MSATILDPTTRELIPLVVKLALEYKIVDGFGPDTGDEAGVRVTAWTNIDRLERELCRALGDAGDTDCWREVPALRAAFEHVRVGRAAAAAAEDRAAVGEGGVVAGPATTPPLPA